MPIATPPIENSPTKNPSIFLRIRWHYLLAACYQLYDNIEQEKPEFTYLSTICGVLIHWPFA